MIDDDRDTLDNRPRASDRRNPAFRDGGAAVVDLAAARAEREPHLAGPALCTACRHEWTAVAPAGTVWLDCPACGTTKGLLAGPVLPAAGEQVWACNCGSYLFVILRSGGFLCVGCGAEQVF